MGSERQEPLSPRSIPQAPRISGIQARRARAGEPVCIAWVNSVGILGGSASPPIVGWFKDVTGSFSGGLYALAIFGLFAAIVAAICVRETPVAVAQQPIGATAD